MLAQTIVPDLRLFGRNTSVSVRLGTIVFVAKQDAVFSQVIHEECVYRVRTTHLLVLNSEDQLLTGEQIKARNAALEKQRQEDIQDQFNRLGT